MSGSRNTPDHIRWLANRFHVDLLPLAFEQRGILKYESLYASGEEYLIANVLPRIITSERPVFIDVGANTGHFSLRLKQQFSNARIIALEPHPTTYETLERATKYADIESFMIGASDVSGQTVIHSYADSHSSEHASLYENVLLDLHHATTLCATDVTLETLDTLANKLGIDQVDFLKIDTEGHELAVLRGATRLLIDNRLRAIQFEFNEMNIVSRVFLKDFYDLLKGFTFFRLDTNKLHPLGKYSPQNEIFQFHNIFALRDDSLNPLYLQMR